MPIKIAVMNLQSGAGVTKGYWEYLLYFWRYFIPHSQKNIVLADEIIKKEKIDLVFANEVAGSSIRTGFVDQAKLINCRYKLSFPTFKFFNLVNASNLIASKNKLIGFKNTRLGGKGEPRFLGETSIYLNNKKISLFIAHLSLSQKSRKIQISEIADLVKKRKRAIIAGDFNIKDSSELELLIDQGFKTFFKNTFPSWQPKRPRDCILVKNIALKKICTLDKKVSDHRILIGKVI